MAKLLKLRRGTTSQHSSFTGAEGEVTVDTTKDTIVVHDGSTAGGVPLAKESAALSLIDEDNMSTNSATRPPSQQSVKAYVDTADALKANLANPTFTGTVNAAALTLSGNLQVNGTTTTVASSTMTVTDKNIEIAKGAANDAAADGGGITLESGDGNKEIKWVNSTDSWTFNQNVEITTGIAKLLGPEGGAATLLMYADEADDNADYWRQVANTDGTFTIANYSTGSWVNSITVSGSGNITGAGTVSDSKGDVRSIPSTSPGSNHVAIAADAGKVIYIAYDVHFNPSVFSAGDAVTIVNNSGNDETIHQGSNFTLYNTADASTGNRTLAGRGMCTVWFAAHNIGYISGAGLS